jgi:hypothetical protein
MKLQENILGNLGLLASRGTAKLVKAYAKPLVSSCMEFIKLVALPFMVNKTIHKAGRWTNTNSWQVVPAASAAVSVAVPYSSVPHMKSTLQFGLALLNLK